MTESELNIVRDLTKKIHDLERQLQALRLSEENIVPMLDGLPKGNSLQSKVEKIVLEIVEQSKELDKLHEKIINESAKLTDYFCRHVPEPNQQTVLILRYIHCLNFRDICEQLNKSDARIYQLHSEALKNTLD